MEAILMDSPAAKAVVSFSGRPRRRQRGAALIVALIMLVALMMGALAMVRSIDTGTLIAGNLAFKQSAVQSGDAGTEAAILWLGDNMVGSTLDNDSGAGYYATNVTALDFTGSGKDAAKTGRVDWNDDNCATNPVGAGGTCFARIPGEIVDATGNKVTYIIHRLCSQAGSFNDPLNRCATISTESSSGKKGEISYTESARFSNPPTPYFRITSQVRGPKNAVSYVQTIVNY